MKGSMEQIIEIDGVEYHVEWDMAGNSLFGWTAQIISVFVAGEKLDDWPSQLLDLCEKIGIDRIEEESEDRRRLKEWLARQ